MPAAVLPIARIRLARSLPRLMALPLVLVLTGAAVAGAAARAQGPLVVALAIVAAALLLMSAVSAALLLSVRMEVEEAGIRLRWVGGTRTYPLSRGAVTRIALRGPNASTLRPTLGAFGWGIGPARLRGTEPIEVVRLAGTDTAIMVPTTRGRLAVAVDDEQQLLAAVASAARARQRLEEPP